MTTGVFESILKEDNHDKPMGYQYMMEEMFGNVKIEGSEILDVGSGRGLTSVYMALNHAKRVVSMEPELDGANIGVINLQKERIEKLALNNIELITDDFNQTQIQDKFDILVSNASINHIKESEQHALKDKPTYDSFQTIAKRFAELLKPGGVAVVTDACRNAFFPMIRRAGLFPKNWCPYGRNINLKIHQDPKVWQKIFLGAGFKRAEIDYPVPYKLRSFRPMLNNPVANYFLQGCFILRAWV